MVNYTETHTLIITDVLNDVAFDIRKILRKIELRFEIFSTIEEYKFLSLIHQNIFQKYVSGETIRLQISLIKSLIKTNTITNIDGDLFNIFFKLTTYIKRRQYDFTPSYVEFDGENYDYNISKEQQQKIDNFKEKHV